MAAVSSARWLWLTLAVVHCCAEAVRIMYETALKHGAPEGVFTCLESPTLPDNAYLMKHKDVGLFGRAHARAVPRKKKFSPAA